MPYRICKTLSIESGHMLTGHPGKCRFPHGHSRKVEVVIEADELDARGMVCDFSEIKKLAGEIVTHYDHALCVNTQDPMHDTLKAAYGDRVVSFVGIDPTSEVMARTFHDALQRRIADLGLRLKRVRVWEGASAWAEYEA